MVALNAQELQTLLYVNADRGTASPNAHDKRWCETTFANRNGHAERVVEERLFFDKGFFDHLIQELIS